MLEAEEQKHPRGQEPLLPSWRARRPPSQSSRDRTPSHYDTSARLVPPPPPAAPVHGREEQGPLEQPAAGSLGPGLVPEEPEALPVTAPIEAAARTEVPHPDAAKARPEGTVVLVDLEPSTSTSSTSSSSGSRRSRRRSRPRPKPQPRGVQPNGALANVRPAPNSKTVKQMAGRLYAKLKRSANEGSEWASVDQLRAEMGPDCDVQAFEMALRKAQFQLMRREGQDFLRIFRRRR